MPEEQEVIDSEPPAPGTHRDVYLYNKRGSIGAYYSDPVDTLFESSVIFCDAVDVHMKFAQTLQNGIDEGKFKTTYRDNIVKAEFERDWERNLFSVPSEYFMFTDMIKKIFLAWSQTAINRRFLPDKRIISDVGMQLLEEKYAFTPRNPVTAWPEPGHQGNKKVYADVYKPQRTVASDAQEASQKFEFVPETINEQIGELSPFSHFPPVGGAYNTALDNLFFNNSQRQSSQVTLINNYGNRIGQNIFEMCCNLNRNIKYSDIIRPAGKYGYNFEVDFRSIGLFNSRYVYPWELFRLDYDALDYFTFLIEKHEERTVLPDGTVVDGKIFNLIRYPDLSNPFDISKKLWRLRDIWILKLMNGGMIPLDQSGFATVGYDNRLSDIYPMGYDAIVPGVQWWQIVVVVIGIIVSAILSYLSGGSITAALMTALVAVITIMVDAVIKKITNMIGGSKGIMAGMTLNSICSGVLNKYVTYSDPNPNPGSDKYQKSLEFFIKAGIKEVQDMDFSQRETLMRTFYIFDINASNRQKVTMEKMTRDRDARFGNFLDGTDYTGNNGLTLDLLEIQRNKERNRIIPFGSIGDISHTNQLNIQAIEKATKDKADRKMLTNLALAGLGGFALWQLLKKK